MIGIEEANRSRQPRGVNKMKFWGRLMSVTSASPRRARVLSRCIAALSLANPLPAMRILVFFIRPSRLRTIVDAVALTESSTLANTLMRFASPLLIKRWFRRNGRRSLGWCRLGSFGAALFEPHDDHIKHGREKKTKAGNSEHSEEDRCSEGLPHFRTGT